MSLLDTSLITRLRKQKGWEQKDLAAAANVNPAVISRLEKGLQNDFKISVIAAVAVALDVPVDNLLIDVYRVTEPNLSPELQSATTNLAKHSFQVQKRIASMIEAYLLSLESEN